MNLLGWIIFIGSIILTLSYLVALLTSNKTKNRVIYFLFGLFEIATIVFVYNYLFLN